MTGGTEPHHSQSVLVENTEDSNFILLEYWKQISKSTILIFFSIAFI